VTQLLLRGAIAYGIALCLSPAMRARAAGFMRSGGFFLLALIAAAWLSLGPSPQVLGRPLDLVSPYRFLWTYLPGLEGLRVPARFAMIVALMLAVLGAFGAAAIARTRHGLVVLGILGALFLYESGAALRHKRFQEAGAVSCRTVRTRGRAAYRPCPSPLPPRGIRSRSMLLPPW